MRKRRKQMHDRLLALVLVIALTIGLMPTSLMPVRADETETVSTDVTATTTDASRLSTETDASVGTPYYFTVEVKDSSGNPIEGATVSFGTLTDADSEEELATNTDAGTGGAQGGSSAASEYEFPVEVTTDANGQASIDLSAYSDALLAAYGISTASAANLLAAANGSEAGVAMQIAVSKDGVTLYDGSYTLSVSDDGTIAALSIGNVQTCTVSAEVTTANGEDDPAYEIVLTTLDANGNAGGTGESQTLTSGSEDATFVAGATVSVAVATTTSDYYLSEAKVTVGEGEDAVETSLTVDAADPTTASSDDGITLGADAVVSLSSVKTYGITVTTMTVSDDDTYTAATGGTVKLDDTQVNASESATKGTSVYSAAKDSGSQLTLNVEAKEGYVISQLTVDGVDKLSEVTKNASGLETCSSTVTVNSATTISVTFVKTYTVTVTISEGEGTASYEINDGSSSSVSSGGTVDVELGDEITVTATPNTNYRVETFTVTDDEENEVSGVAFDDGQNGTTDTFEARNDDERTATWTPGEDATVTITFMYNLYTVDVDLAAENAANATTQVTVNGTALAEGVTTADVRYSQNVEVKLTWNEESYYLDNDTVTATMADGTSVAFVSGSTSTDESAGEAALTIAGTSVKDDITVSASIKAEDEAAAVTESGYVNKLTGVNGETVYVYAETETATITAPDGYTYVSLDAKPATTDVAKTSETISSDDADSSGLRTITAIYFGKDASDTEGIGGIVWSAADTTSYIIVFDTAEPSAELTLTDENQEEIYGTDGVTFSVTATDSAEDYNSGVASIDWWVGDEDAETTATVMKLYTYETGTPQTSVDTYFTVDAGAYEGDGLVVTVKVIDLAGNESYTTSGTFDVDTTAPVISVSYDDTDDAGNVVNPVSNGKYFAKTRTATIVITEDHFDADTATAGITITAKDVKGNDLEDPSATYTINGWTTDGTGAAATHTATITYYGDANYTFDISYTDEAGNTAVAVEYSDATSAVNTEFTVDTTDPTGSVTITDADQTNVWSRLLSILTFGLYDNNEAEVTLAAEDETSPVASIEYTIKSGSAAAEVLGYDALEALADEAWTAYTETFTKDSDDTFVVYARITDCAGNYTYVSSDGYIVDKTAPVEISIVPADSTGDDYTGDFTSETADYGFNKDHEDGVKLNISVSDVDDNDNTSGIQSIEYWATCDGVTTQSGTVSDETALYEFAYADTSYADETVENPSYSDLLTEWTGDITVDTALNNSCDVTVTVKVTDNAGNSSEASITLDIDVTAPTIAISYDNNDAEHEKYFDNTRTATIVITERTSHFDAADATDGIAITAVDADGNEVVADGETVVYTISEWTIAEDASGDQNAATHTATVTYAADANYTFAITYTDEAGNTVDPDEDVTCAEGTVAPYDFAVDTAAAEAVVSIDGYSWTEFVERLSMGLYDNDGTADVSVDTTDATSPIDYVGYYIATYTDADAAEEAEDGTLTETVVAATAAELETAEWITLHDYAAVAEEARKNTWGEDFLTVDADATFVIYVKVVDYAGNVLYVSSDGYIVDTAAPDINVFAPQDEQDFQSDVSDYGFNLTHQEGVVIDVDVDDVDTSGNYSGIKTVEYWVVNNDTNVTTQNEVLFDYTGDDYGYEQSGYVAGSTDNPTYSELVTSYSGTITVGTAENNDCSITVTLQVTDNAGNVTTKSFTVDIDVTAPTVSVSYDDTAADVRNDNYFLDTRTATIVVTERTNHFRGENVLITISAVDAEGNKVDPAKVLSIYNSDAEDAAALTCYTDEEGTTDRAAFAAASAGWSWTLTKDKDGNEYYLLSVRGWNTVEAGEGSENDATHTIYITYEGDANYTFAIDYTDYSGDPESYLAYYGVNEEAYTEFTVDLTDPYGTVTMEDDEQKTVWSTLLSILTFGLFDDEKVTVTIDADDVTSPIETIMYHVVTGEAAATALGYDDLEALGEVEGAWTSNEGADDLTTVTFMVAEDETLVVYAKITDYAGNYTYLCSDGYIVDQTAPVVTTFAPADAVDAETGEVDTEYAGDFESEESDYGFNLDHADGVDVAISVTDVTEDGDYSGISKVEYWIVNEDVIDETTGEGTETQRETLYDNEYSDLYDYTFETDDENEGGNTAAILSYEDLLTEFNDTITVNTTDNNNCNITVYLGVTDNAGNYTEESFTVDIDVTAPTIEISYDYNDATHDKYFDTERTATIVITERTNHFSAADATEGITITAFDAYGVEVTDGYTISDWTTTDATGTEANTATHTATITYEADANYTFAITYTDEAGNTAEQVVLEDGTVLCAEYEDGTVAPEEFTVDKTTSTGTITIDGYSWTEFVTRLSMGLYDADETDAEAAIDTQDATSPLESVSYYVVTYSADDAAEEGADETVVVPTQDELEAAEWITLYDCENPTASAGTLGTGANTYQEQFLNVTPDETFVIYVKVVDYAGNVFYVSSDGYILDTTAATINTFAPVDEADFASDTSDYGYNLEHKDGIDVYISVNDVDENGNYSGLKTVKYWVVNNDTGVTTQEETLFDFTGDDFGYEQSEYEVNNTDNPTYSDLVTSFADTITVETEKNNNCDVTVWLEVTDNAGNVTTSSFTLDIDVTAPTIDISYDNNAARNDTYFGATRTATIVITERTSHFDPYVATDGITITAYDAYGNAVTIPTVNGWTTEDASGSAANTATHTATIEYLADANYTFAITYTDNAGNEASLTYATGTVAPEKFTVDLTDPFGSVTMTDDDQTNTWTTLLSVLTFGLYDDSRVKVDIAAEDATSLIESIKYYIVSGSAAATRLTSSDLDALADSSWTSAAFTANTAAVNFTRSADETMVVYVKLTDYAGNYIYMCTDGYIVDKTNPTITTLKPADAQDFASETAQYGFNLNHSSGVKINIAASDVTSSGDYSGIQSVEYWVTCDGTTTQSGTVANGNALYNFGYYDTSYADSAVSNPTYSSLKTDWSGSITVDAAKNNSCDVTVTVKVTDNAGNSTTKSITLDIDVTAPTISFSYDNNTARNSKYFDASRTATIVITERTSHFSATNATAGITITAVDSSGNAVTIPTVSSWTTASGSTADAATHTATINYTTDANYTFAITYTDNAGNTATQIVSTSTAPYNFTVDKTAPTADVTATSAEGSTQTWRSVISSLTFGFVSKESISVAGTSQDATSPIESVKYYKTSATTAMAKTQLAALSSSSWTTVSTSSKYANYTLPTISQDEQFTYYLQITDYAGNVTYISTNGMIVDETDPRTETIAPVVTISQPINGIYNEDVTVDVLVEDPTVNGTYSGLYEIHYEIYSLGELTESGVLYQFSNSNPTQSELDNIWTGTITIHADLSGNNSNEVYVVVYATDNSENSSTTSTYDLNGEYIMIDTTKPTIQVSYDNNTALTSGSMTLFKETRTATVTITERNFDPEDVIITITNTDGTIPSTPTVLSNWTKVPGTGNEDNTTWTATISYVADGDYTFAITYTDEAGNEYTDISGYGANDSRCNIYATGTVAGSEFTVDRTLPIITVTYDNNDAENSNYYAKSRTATITIVEHNFSSTGVTLTLNSYEEEDGDSKTGPAMTAWTTSGDVHTAQITFNEDGYYVFDIAYTDEAGNTASEYVGNNGTNGDNFTVDLTAPEVKFLDGAVDGGAYVGDVSPDFEISDNIAIDTYEITLKKYTMDGDLVEVDYSSFEGSSHSLEDHLSSFVLGNIPDDSKGSDDGVYVLKVSVTDKAGNSSEDSITFSVNRHGSVFVINTLTDAYGNAVKGTYTNSELAPIVIYEYNSNEVSEANRQVILIINGVETELSSDQYTVETVYDGNGWYKYIITILADNFSQDGTYRVQIISTDETDRTVSVVSDVNSTSADEAAISFTVDRTAPTIVMTNIVDNYKEIADSYLVKFHVTDNIGMSEIRVYVYDENSSKPSDATYVWSADPGENEMELNSDGDYEFTLTESNVHQIIEIEAVDLAGNVQTTLDDDDSNRDSVTTISGILITPNRWVQFVNNTPLFVGSIILLIILIALIIFLILWKRKKDKDKEQEKAKQEAADGAQKKSEASAKAKKSGKKS